ncbi:MAG: hypothetical protein ACI9DJ_000027 [Algoriphagus sp.]|jgi:hypothetical protein
MKKRIIAFLLGLLSFYQVNAQCVGQSGQVKWHIWQNTGVELDSAGLAINEFYPESPTQTLVLGSLSSPANFAEYYASLIRGYISVPTTASYYFNITSDDGSSFHMSTDESKANLVEMAHLPGYTGVTEHKKYEADQTSPFTTLVGGQNYYFEIHQFEGAYSDHLNLYWRIPDAPDMDTLWQIVDFNYIKDFDCEISCPQRGIACNDGNAQTTNDQQDGHCNCVGTYPSSNPDVGERGLVEAYYYDNIDGNYVENDLIDAPNFPLVPDRKEELEGAYGPLNVNTNSDYGTLVQGYLTVPVTGQYEFNITGDNQTFFFLSKNDSVQYKQSSQALVYYSSYNTEHDKSVFQSIGPIQLEVGRYYYYEFRHKENSYNDFFNLHWKTPFQNKKGWKRIPKFYLFDYTAEIACIAQGTPCDDGNTNTNNDVILANCDCVGTPCSGPDCDDQLASYNFYEKAKATTSVVSTANNSWLSCGVNSANPNTERAVQTNWILYDFTHQYKFRDTRIWNYNVAAETIKGFKNVLVDYSIDGATWIPHGGIYVWPQAPGVSDYAGFAGPNFNDIKARYILISAVDNHGDASCSGFSKISFDALQCDEKDTPCDDQDPLTTYDKFDDNCNCLGIDLNCASDTLDLIKETLADGAFKAKMRIKSESLLPNTTNISFTAGNSIVLLPGFEVSAQAVFTADIENCIQVAFQANQVSEKKKVQEVSMGPGILENDSRQGIKKVIFRLNEAGDVKLILKDDKGKILAIIIDSYYQNLGTQIKYIPTNRLKAGTYTIELKINGNVVTEIFTTE